MRSILLISLLLLLTLLATTAEASKKHHRKGHRDRTDHRQDEHDHRGSAMDKVQDLEGKKSVPKKEEEEHKSEEEKAKVDPDKIKQQDRTRVLSPREVPRKSAGGETLTAKAPGELGDAAPMPKSAGTHQQHRHRRHHKRRRHLYAHEHPAEAQADGGKKNAEEPPVVPKLLALGPIHAA